MRRHTTNLHLTSSPNQDGFFVWVAQFVRQLAYSRILGWPQPGEMLPLITLATFDYFIDRLAWMEKNLFETTLPPVHLKTLRGKQILHIREQNYRGAGTRMGCFNGLISIFEIKQKDAIIQERKVEWPAP